MGGTTAPAHSLTGSLIARYRVGPRLKQLRLDRAAAIYASSDNPPTEVWLSTSYLVQIFADRGYERMTVNRTTVLPSGRWGDGITWDALQRLKAECGRGDRWAAELYPPDAAVVDVANLRHLWLLPGPPAFGWNRRLDLEHEHQRAITGTTCVLCGVTMDDAPTTDDGRS